MSADFEKIFAKAKDLATEYRKDISKRQPRPTISAEELRTLFGTQTPQAGTDGEQVIDHLVRASDAGILSVPGPRFFSWVMGASNPVGVGADWMASAWGQNNTMYGGSPAASMAEDISGQWLIDILGLPKACSVGFVTGATMASFVGLAAARSEILKSVGWDVEEDGLVGAPKVDIFIGEHAHATIYSALQYLGFGRRGVIKIATDINGRMNADSLKTEMAKSKNPKIVITQAGQINTGAFDPFEEIIPLAKNHGAWVHVDGAFGLWAQSSTKLKHLSKGVEGADSWSTDGHKWLQVPYDCGYVFVKNKEAHSRAMSIKASYLPSSENNQRDPSEYVPELSRRARGFATWAMIKHLGHQGIAKMVERHCALAQRLADALKNADGIHVVNDVVLNQLAISFGPDPKDKACDQYTLDVLQALRKENRFIIGGAKWRGQEIMRVSIISEPTTESDIDALAEDIKRIWKSLNPQQG